jgi:hypothetical protein
MRIALTLLWLALGCGVALAQSQCASCSAPVPPYTDAQAQAANATAIANAQAAAVAAAVSAAIPKLSAVPSSGPGAGLCKFSVVPAVGLTPAGTAGTCAEVVQCGTSATYSIVVSYVGNGC